MATPQTASFRKMSTRRSTRRTAGQSPARLGQGDGYGQGAAGAWASNHDHVADATPARTTKVEESWEEYARWMRAPHHDQTTMAKPAFPASPTKAKAGSKAGPALPHPDECKPFTFSLTDPTVIFVIVCALVPPLKARDREPIIPVLRVLLQFNKIDCRCNRVCPARAPGAWRTLITTVARVSTAFLGVRPGPLPRPHPP